MAIFVVGFYNRNIVMSHSSMSLSTGGIFGPMHKE